MSSNTTVLVTYKIFESRWGKETIDVLEEVWDRYGHFDAAYLEDLTHQEKPWQLVRENLEESDISDNVITQNSMKSFYSEMLKSYQNGQEQNTASGS